MAHYYLVMAHHYLSHEEREFLNVLQGDARSPCHAQEGIFCHVERDINLVGQALVETTQERTAASEVNAVLNDVGIEFGRRLFQSGDDGLLDSGD